jgi:hypothetical protein
MCIVLHFLLAADFDAGRPPNVCVQTKSLIIKDLSRLVTRITRVSNFGAASASLLVTKEAANSSTMTFTLSTRHFPNRSGWRNGALHRLS